MDVKSVSFACPRRLPSLFRWKLFLLYVILLLEAVAGVTLLPAPHSLRLLVGNIYWNEVFIQRWPSLMSGTMRRSQAGTAAMQEVERLLQASRTLQADISNVRIFCGGIFLYERQCGGGWKARNKCR